MSRFIRILVLPAVALLVASVGSTTSYASPQDSISRLNEATQDIGADSDVSQYVGQHGRSSDHTLVPFQDVQSPRFGLETIKFQHFYKGVEVVGSVVFHHKGKRGKKVRHSLIHLDNLSVQPSVNSAQAISVALRRTHNPAKVRTQAALKILPIRQIQQAALVWYVHVTGAEIAQNHTLIIDAHNGNVFADMEDIETIAPLEVRSAQGLETFVDPATFFPGADTKSCEILSDGTGNPRSRGTPLAINPQACPLKVSSSGQTSTDPTAQNAAKNSAAVLDYYLTHHSRNSFDDKGATVVSIIHVGDKFNNAFWNPAQNIMAYGDGDPASGLGDFSVALDVAGHEMTHGVTSHTANLQMMDESGALNEANSDFFGKLIANDGDWVVGKKIFLDQTHNPGIRDLQRPENLTFKTHDSQGNVTGTKPYPSRMVDKMTAQGPCDGTNDRCFVHINSTIPSHAAYLVAQALGKTKAEQLYYLVLTHLMQSTETFKDMSKDVQEGCQQIGFSAADCAQVKTAYAAVGL